MKISMCFQGDIERDERTLVAAAVSSPSEDVSLLKDKIGVKLRVLSCHPVPGGTKVEFETSDRCRIESVQDLYSVYKCTYETIKSTDTLNPSKYPANFSKRLRKIIKKYEKRFLTFPSISKNCSWSELINGAALVMPIPLDKKQELLKCDSLEERADQILEILDLTSNFRKSYPAENTDLNVSRALESTSVESKQPSSSPISLSDQINRSDMPDEIKKIALKEEQRMRGSSNTSAEYADAKQYLELLLKLPWTTKKENIDIKQAKEILDSHHYGMENVKRRIIEHIAVMKLKETSQGSVLILCGPPGVGKTSLSKSIAEALGRKYYRISLGGVSDEAVFRGFERTYTKSNPGRLIQAVVKTGTKNPVIVLDEVDKMGKGNGCDLEAVLLEVLDPEQNSTFTDHYLNIEYDLSDVFFICTANDLSHVSKPLLNRAEVIELSAYTPQEKFAIAKKYVISEALKETGLKGNATVQLTDGAVLSIVRDYTNDSGIRDTKRIFKQIFRSLAPELAENGYRCFQITEDNLKDYLGEKQSKQIQAKDFLNPGAATGMAWTEDGGQLMFVEACFLPGNGCVNITGNVGKVMEESINVACSLVRSKLAESDNPFDFSKHDLHVHFQQGGVPKDGPSAGTAAASAILSAVLGISANPKVSMTGEISLTGEVLPVGGIKEKVIGAQQAGIQTVLLPSANKKDIEAIPEDIRRKLNFVFAENIDQVFNTVFGKRNQNIAVINPNSILNQNKTENFN